MSRTRKNWLGAAALTIAAVAATLAGATPAVAAGNGDASCLADASGGLFPSADRIEHLQDVTIRWAVQAACPIAVHITGLFFDPSENLPGSGSRLVSPGLIGSYTWELDVTATRSGLTEEFDVRGVTVVAKNFSTANEIFQAPGGAATRISAAGIAPLTVPAMAAGTSPSMIGSLDGAGYQAAYQGADHNLWTVSPFGVATNTNLGMMPGTSPAIAPTSNGFEVAFQANTGVLWTYRSPAGTGSPTTLAMAAGTSPSITLAPSGAITVAAAGSDHLLWTVGPSGVPASTGRTMAAATSPAITEVPFPEGFEVAYHGTDGTLHWQSSTGADSPSGVAMEAGTSPSATIYNDGTVVAMVEGGDDHLTAAGLSSGKRIALPMALGTSPAVTILPSGFAEVAYLSNDGTLWTVAFTAANYANYVQDTTQQEPARGTVPAIAAIPQRF